MVKSTRSCSPAHIVNISPNKSFVKKNNSVRFCHNQDAIKQSKTLLRQETTEMFFPSVNNKLNNISSNIHSSILKSAKPHGENQQRNRQDPVDPIYMTKLPLPSSPMVYGN